MKLAKYISRWPVFLFKYIAHNSINNYVCLHCVELKVIGTFKTIFVHVHDNIHYMVHGYRESLQFLILTASEARKVHFPMPSLFILANCCSKYLIRPICALWLIPAHFSIYVDIQRILNCGSDKLNHLQNLYHLDLLWFVLHILHGKTLITLISAVFGF